MNEKLLSILECPRCHKDITMEGEFIICRGCDSVYPIKSGILCMLSEIDSNEGGQKRFYDHVYIEENNTKLYDNYIKETFFEVVNNKYFYPLFYQKHLFDKTVLDIGCGGGNVGRRIATNVGYLVNLDVSFNALMHAKKTIAVDKTGYIQGTVNNLPLKEESIDVVVAYFTLHHLNDLSRPISEIKRVLKKTGYFVFIEPFERLPWMEMWLDLLKTPQEIRALFLIAYKKIQRKLAKSQKISTLKDRFCGESFQKHFFKTFDEYEKCLVQNNFDVQVMETIFLEYLPPRFFSLPSEKIVERLFKAGDMLMNIFPSISKKGKFVVAQAFK